MTSDDVRAFLVCRKGTVGKPDMAKDISAMRKLFRFHGSKAVEQCLTRFPILSVKNDRCMLEPLTEAERMAVLSRSVSCPDGLVKPYAMAVIAMECGTRTSELRLMDAADVDLLGDPMTVTIRHPKAEGSYGRERTVPIHPLAYPIIIHWLEMRPEGLGPALFPSGGGGYLSSNSMREELYRVNDDLGMDLDFRILRRTFAQSYIDAGLKVDDLAVLMGHSKVSTTWKFYGRPRGSAAISAAADLWKMEKFDGKSRRAAMLDGRNGALDGIRTRVPASKGPDDWPLHY